MGGGNSHQGKKSKGGGGNGNKENGLELYRQFVEGGSYDIHKKLGYDPFTGEEIAVDRNAARDIDSVFEAAQSDIVTYKGMAVTDEVLDQIASGTYKNRTISSTSMSKVTAESYAANADFEFTSPLLMNIKIKKGTRVANAQKLLGNSGMKGFEREITEGRNTNWKFKNLRTVSKGGDDYYVVDVVVQ